MPSNISQDTTPSFWSSANDDVIYKFSFNPYPIDTVNNDGGNVEINLEIDFDVLPVPGDYIYVNSNVYIGTFKVLSVGSTSNVTIDTPYVSGVTTHIYNCYHLRMPVFSFYKGYKPGELFNVELPYTKVVDQKPSILYNQTTGIPYLEINVRSLTRSIFKIEKNTVANSVDFSMFNSIRFVWDGISTINSSIYDYNLVLNSAISNNDLNLNYVSGGRYLIPINKPLISAGGTSIYSIFETVIIIYPVFGPVPVGVYPVAHKFINGVKR